MANSMGLLAMVSSLAIILIGLPAQIYKNYVRKSTEGLSLLLMASACWSYCVWALYGFYKGDLYILVAQAPGFILGLILLGQIFFYGWYPIVSDGICNCKCAHCSHMRAPRRNASDEINIDILFF